MMIASTIEPDFLPNFIDYNSVNFVATLAITSVWDSAWLAVLYNTIPFSYHTFGSSSRSDEMLE
jgi:hypothetical protein